MAKWELVDDALDLGDLTEHSDDGPLIPRGLQARFDAEDRSLFIWIKQADEDSPAAYTVTLQRDHGPQPFHYIVEGIQLKSEGGGLQSADLRDIPLRELISKYLVSRVVLPHDVQQLPIEDRAKLSGVPDVPREVREAWPNGDRDLIYRWVDLIYNSAIAHGKPPTKTVGEKFKVNPGTGARLVRYARDAGVLTSSSANDPRKRKGTKKDEQHPPHDD